MLQRTTPKRPRLRPIDRLLWILLSTVWRNWRQAVQIVTPATVVRWHRRAFAAYWRWNSRPRRAGRPPLAADLRALIRQMRVANPLWGAPRIHGELQKLGIDVSPATVAKYLERRTGPPSQSWRTFLANHVADLASIDFFTVPTATFRVLFVFVVLSHDRRCIVHLNVTAHPTAEWTAQQLREAWPWDTAPRFVIRDRDAIYGSASPRTLQHMSIEDVLTAPRCPWQAASWRWALLSMVARKPRLLQKLQHLFDLLAEDSWTNVYAGELEVRHQVRPPLSPTKGLGTQLLVKN